jgi:hypothetical protein
MIWAGTVARLRELNNAYEFLFGELKKKEPHQGESRRVSSSGI